jgi:hypothetical protein
MMIGKLQWFLLRSGLIVLMACIVIGAQIYMADKRD